MTEAVLEALGEKPVILSDSEGSPGEEPVILSDSKGSPEEEPVILSDSEGSPEEEPVILSDSEESPKEEPVILSEAKDPPVQSALSGGFFGRGPQNDSAAPDLRAHFDSLCAQAAVLREDFPDFDLAAALRDPAFLRLTSPALGVGAREAWGALHPEQLSQRAARRAAQEARELLARAAAQGARRPREGGGFDAAALTRSDYRSLPRGERERLKERIREAAARGERVFP